MDREGSGPRLNSERGPRKTPDTQCPIAGTADFDCERDFDSEHRTPNTEVSHVVPRRAADRGSTLRLRHGPEGVGARFDAAEAAAGADDRRAGGIARRGGRAGPRGREAGAG